MKYLILPMLVLLCIAGNAHAQKKSFSFGVKGGVNLSNAKENTNIPFGLGNKTSKWGYQIGFNANYRLSSAWYLQSGLSLTTKGVKHEDTEVWIGSTNPPITTWVSTTNQMYLQLPLKVGYKISLSRSANLFAHAGPYMAYGIGGKETVKEKTTPSSVRADEKFTTNTFGKEDRRYAAYNITRLDYGACFGIGMEYRKMTAGFDYELGLRNISETTESVSPSLPVDYRNRNGSFTIGYLF